MNIKFSPVNLIIFFVIAFLLLPFVLALIFIFFQIPWVKFWNLEFCITSSCLEIYSEKYFKPFSWYSNWLGVLYNITTTLGVLIAVLTYYKTVESQAIGSHFSNVNLFKNYISEEVSKKEWLSIASFDLMVWYLQIYPKSKSGDMTCSDNYISIVNELASCILRSNSGDYTGKKTGYKFATHQKLVKNLYKSIGISIKETNRVTFHEIEGEILDLIVKVNKSFPNSEKFNKFEKRAYK